MFCKDSSCKVLGTINTIRFYLKDVFLLLVRLYWGYGFLMAGWGKFMNFSQTVGFFGEKLGIPFPTVNVFLAAGAELIGGLLLLLGACSKIVPIPLIFTMIVAYLTAHNEELMSIFSDPEKFLTASPFLYLMASLIIWLFGAGKYSLENFCCKSCCGGSGTESSDGKCSKTGCGCKS